MRAVRFHEFGEPDVLRVDEVPAPHAGPGRIRVAVHACGLNPADWVLCDGGMFGGELPQGIGLEVSGTVDEIGEGVDGVALGDRVAGPVRHGAATAGAADSAVLSTWALVPDGLDMVRAAAVPLAAATVNLGLEALGVEKGEVLLIHAAGGVLGAAAVQLALRRGARVIATAGPARAGALRALGAEVTGYGEGMAGRVAALAGGPIDRALDINPRHLGFDSVLPTLVELTGDPDRVVTLTDRAASKTLGLRGSDLGPEAVLHLYDKLDEFLRLAADGALTLPIGRTFPLDRIHEAARLSRTGHPGGKLLLLPSEAA